MGRLSSDGLFYQMPMTNSEELAMELFEERSAIREYSGGYERPIAESLGSRDTREYLENLYTKKTTSSSRSPDKLD
jgi:hypothetical protein